MGRHCTRLPGATWGGGSRINRDGRAIHWKRGGGGSYSQLWLTIGTWQRHQARAGLTTYVVYGRRSHKMKQTQNTRVVSGESRGSSVLAGKRKGSSSHSGEWRGSGVLSGASSLLHLGRAGTERKHRNRC